MFSCIGLSAKNFNAACSSRNFPLASPTCDVDEADLYRPRNWQFLAKRKDPADRMEWWISFSFSAFWFWLVNGLAGCEEADDRLGDKVVSF